MTHNNDDEINLFDYLNVLVKRRWMIVRNVVITAFGILIISFFLPKSYTARTTLLPPDESQQSGILTSLVGSPLANFGLPQATSTSDLFVQILMSRTVFDNVLQTKFTYNNKPARNLLSILNYESLEKARKALNKNVNISTSQEGIITIKVELFNRKLAADVANSFVTELDKVNMEKNTSRAKNSRVYIENQLKLTEKKMREASDSLALFKEQYKAVSLEDQTRTAIEKAGEIKGNIIAREVELGVALQTMKADNVYIIQLKKEIEELKKQYNYLQFGDSVALSETSEFYIPFANVPEVGLELARKIRDVKVQETVWELLNQQYYQAKIQEAKDTPTVQALDKAVPPEQRSRPKRKILILVFSFLAFIGSIFWAFALEYFEHVKDDPNSKQLMETVRTDARRVQSNFQKMMNMIRSKK